MSISSLNRIAMRRRIQKIMQPYLEAVVL